MLQSDYFQPFTANHVFQYIAGANGRQLVYVPYKNQAGSWCHCPQQGMHQHNIHHGSFVNDDDIRFNGIFFISVKGLSADIFSQKGAFQHTVNGLGFYTCGFAHALCRSSCGRRQHYLTALVF